MTATQLPRPDERFPLDVAVIGGAGHVGLPLAITFAETGLKTVVFDVDQKKVDQINAGVMPFQELDAPEKLRKALDNGLFRAYGHPGKLSQCKFIVCIVGTPVDEHLNPSFTGIHRALNGCLSEFRDGQILILRSTVFPGISEHVQRFFQQHSLDIKVSFCPERVAQGFSIREFHQLPQIVSAFEPETVEQVKELFGRFAPEFIEMSPMEAELCKLMTNAWRYLQFAAVNQFYMIASSNGLDFNRILHGCRHNYPRMAGFPSPGLAAGPCLVKDTMQLAAFSQNAFMLGHAAMLVNEGLPAHLISLAKKQKDLKPLTVGILGMAFKAECDDPRDSLSYKLKKLLTLESRQVLTTDPFVSDRSLVPLERVLKEASVLFIATPHKAYKGLKVPEKTVVIDVWNCVVPASTSTGK